MSRIYFSSVYKHHNIFVPYTYCTKELFVCALYLYNITTCFVPYICYNKAINRKPSTKRKEEKQMKTYKIFVNGMYVGTEDFTRSEVTAIESDQDIKLIEK